MPDPITVTDADSFSAEAKRLFKQSVDGLSPDDRAKVGSAIRRANGHAQQLIGLGETHPSYELLRANLLAERSTIQNILYADKLRDANELVKGVMDAVVDLAITLAIGAI